LRLSELAHGPVSRHIAADAGTRGRLAAELGIDGLDRLEAELEVEPWLDGAKVHGRLDAVVRQTCGVTLEPLESEIAQDFELKLLPEGSPNAPVGPADVIDPDAEDPPDLIAEDQIDIGAIVIEQLALEIDPFPRKPDAVFEAGPQEQPPSPFAVLKDFKPRGS
jgi:uncharacterized metal-binding protein YceD (DUF177 family)